MGFLLKLKKNEMISRNFVSYIVLITKVKEKLLKMKKILYILIAGMIFFSSCQEEEREIIDPNIDNTIPKDSQLAKLMRNVVIHDGSFDDIVDSGNCYSINLPYSLLVNGEEFIVNEINDYQKLSNTDIIEIQYPIVITMFDYSEEIISNDTELKIYIEQCQIDDEDIECIDFLYPIQVSTFNNRSNELNSIVLNHDSEMYLFMSKMDNNISVSMNYPISLLLYNGQSVDVQHNSGLLETISRVASACDENDK